jgi:glycerate 2-kinase
VTGDDPTHIASGPCAPDPSTYGEALDILARFGVMPPASVATHLREGAAGRIAETPKPGDRSLARAENHVIATAHASLVAAAEFMRERGIAPLVLGDSVTGEAREVAKVYAALARERREHSPRNAPPVALISGGETTVTLKGKGRGGRNAEFLLSLAIALDGEPGIFAIAGDTDGVDGLEEIAGAIIAPDTLARAWEQGIRPRDSLERNDGHGFFSALGDSVVTGPTLTNVNDFRAVLVTLDPAAR